MGTSHASAALDRGMALARGGDAAEALAHLAEARRGFTDAGDAQGAARVDVELARALAARSEAERATALLDDVGVVADRLGDADLAARALVARGEIAATRGDDVQARSAWRGARRHFEAYWDGAALAVIYAGLSRLEADPATAATLSSQALEEARQSGDALALGRALVALARVRAAAGDVDAAQRAFRDAAEVLEAHAVRRELAEVCLGFGVFLGELGDASTGSWLSRAHRLYRELGALRDVERVRDAFRRFGRRASDRGGDVALRHWRGELAQLAAQQPALAHLHEGLRLAAANLVAERDAAYTLLELVRALAADEPGRQPLALAQMAAELTRADRAVVALVDDSGALVLRGALRMPEADEGWRPAAEAARGRPLRHAADGARPDVMACPVRRGDRLFGVIYCDKALAGGPFGDAELSLLVALGEQAAAIFDAGRLGEALRRELRVRGAALDALPDGVVALSSSGRVAAWNRAAAELLGASGDSLPPTLDDWPELAAAAHGEAPHALTLPGGTCQVETHLIGNADQRTTILVLTAQRRAALLARRVAGAGREVHFGDLVGRSAALRRAVRAAEAAAAGDGPVLLAGEPGTGKRTLARAIHAASSRGAAPLFTLDAGSAPRGTLGDELFGTPGRPGLVEIAEDGALLLGDIADLPLDAQLRLGALLEERRGPRLYATTVSLFDEGSRRPLARELSRVLRPRSIVLPPLRERPEDLDLLVEHLLPRLSQALGKAVTSMAPEVLEVLAAHPWPGNVRELELLLELEVYAASPDQDLLFTVPGALASAEAHKAPGAAPARSLLEVEHQLLLAALKQHRGNVPRVARTLGVSKGTVYNMMRKFRVDPSSYRVS